MENLRINVLQCLTAYITNCKENGDLEQLRKIIGVVQFAKVIGEKNIYNIVFNFNKIIYFYNLFYK